MARKPRAPRALGRFNSQIYHWKVVTDGSGLAPCHLCTFAWLERHTQAVPSYFPEVPTPWIREGTLSCQRSPGCCRVFAIQDW